VLPTVISAPGLLLTLTELGCDELQAATVTIEASNEQRERIRADIASRVPLVTCEIQARSQPRTDTPVIARGRQVLTVGEVALRYAVPRVTFEPLGVTVECAPDESIFACARKQGVLIPTACNGNATCGLCRVKVIAGEQALAPISPAETRHLGNTYFITKLRLSCQLHPTGDVIVRIPDMPDKLKKR
jgi:ferredoxin